MRLRADTSTLDHHWNRKQERDQTVNPRAVRSTVGDLWRSACARVFGSAIVLAYHRVADLSCDPQCLAVDVAHFDEQMRLISEAFTIVSASDLLELVAKRKRLPKRSVVVTIDDGYCDTLHNAKPVLAAHSVPATVFVSSDYVGADREFWWDEIERVVLHAAALPSGIQVAIGDATYRTRIEPDASSAAESVEPLDGWDIRMPPVNERQRVYLELRESMLRLSSADRDAALGSLRAQFGVAPFVRPTHRPLSVYELRDLASSGLIEIGAHTRSHQMLSARSAAEQREEVLGSKRALEEMLGGPVRLFSYPYGDVDAFTALSERTVRDAGLFGAFTTRFGMTLPWTDRFAVPRCPSENVRGQEFVKRIDRWFEMAR